MSFYLRTELIMMNFLLFFCLANIHTGFPCDSVLVSKMMTTKEGVDGATPQTEMDALLLGRTHVSMNGECTQLKEGK